MYNLHQYNIKRQNKDIEEMAKGQMRPEKATPKNLSYTQKRGKMSLQ